MVVKDAALCATRNALDQATGVGVTADPYDRSIQPVLPVRRYRHLTPAPFSSKKLRPSLVAWGFKVLRENRHHNQLSSPKARTHGLAKCFSAIRRVSNDGLIMHDDKLAEELLLELLAVAGPLQISVGLLPGVGGVSRLFFLPSHGINPRGVFGFPYSNCRAASCLPP